jgi:hypothetical protein
MKKSDIKGESTAVGRMPEPSTATTSRRQFAKTLAVIAATPLLGSAMQFGRETPEGAGRGADALASAGGSETTPPHTATGDESALQAQDEKPTPDAEAIAEVVRIRYGKNLTDDQLAEVKRSINGRIRNADRLKQFKLANGDEPAFVFSAGPDPIA